MVIGAPTEIGHLRISLLLADRWATPANPIIFWKLAFHPEMDYLVDLDDGTRRKGEIIHRFGALEDAQSVANELISLAQVCDEEGILDQIDWRKELTRIAQEHRSS